MKVNRCPQTCCAVVACLALLPFLAGCSSGRSAPQAWVPSAARIVWPNPPARARIEYVGALRAGFPGKKESFTRKIGHLFVGRREKLMIRPAAVGGNRAGLIAVADPGVPTVHIYDFPASRYTQPSEETVSRLRCPVGIAVASDGRIFVADSQQERIFVLGPAGDLLNEWGSGVLKRPTGLALDASGDRLFVVDAILNQVLSFDQNGRLTNRFGERGLRPGQFNYPIHAALTPDGRLCLTDSMNFRVQVFSLEGEPQLAFGSAGDSAGDFTRPKGIGTDSRGRYYVVDGAFENVQIFDPQGRLLLAFGNPGTGPGELSLPTGIYLGPDNRIYVADSFNSRIQVFQLLEGEDS